MPKEKLNKLENKIANLTLKELISYCLVATALLVSLGGALSLAFNPSTIDKNEPEIEILEAPTDVPEVPRDTITYGLD